MTSRISNLAIAGVALAISLAPLVPAQSACSSDPNFIPGVPVNGIPYSATIPSSAIPGAGYWSAANYWLASCGPQRDNSSLTRQVTQSFENHKYMGSQMSSLSTTQWQQLIQSNAISPYALLTLAVEVIDSPDQGVYRTQHAPNPPSSSTFPSGYTSRCDCTNEFWNAIEQRWECDEWECVHDPRPRNYTVNVAFNNVNVHQISPFNAQPLIGVYDLNPDPLHVLWGSYGTGTIGAEFPVAASQWKHYHYRSFYIPIDRLHFPYQRGTNGSLPVPGIDSVRITLSSQDFGMRLGDVRAEIFYGAASPVVLVHGINQQGYWWEKPRDIQNKSFIDGFAYGGGTSATLKWPRDLIDNSVNLAQDKHGDALIRDNVFQLRVEVPNLARQYGSHRVHLVSHSKGGLDVRGYLYSKARAKQKFPVVITAATLSTPHAGSVLADLTDGVRNSFMGQALAYDTDWVNPSPGIENLTRLGTWSVGYPDLRTDQCFFNNTNHNWRTHGALRTLAIGADMDFNSTTSVDNWSEILRLAEDEERQYGDSPTRVKKLNTLIAHYPQAVLPGLNDVYQLLGSTRAIAVVDTTIFPSRPTMSIRRMPAPASVFQGNDVLVTVKSALGYPVFGTRSVYFQQRISRDEPGYITPAPVGFAYPPAKFGNHSTVGDAYSAHLVRQFIDQSSLHGVPGLPPMIEWRLR